MAMLSGGNSGRPSAMPNYFGFYCTRTSGRGDVFVLAPLGRKVTGILLLKLKGLGGEAVDKL